MSWAASSRSRLAPRFRVRLKYLDFSEISRYLSLTPKPRSGAALQGFGLDTEAFCDAVRVVEVSRQEGDLEDLGVGQAGGPQPFHVLPPHPLRIPGELQRVVHNGPLGPGQRRPVGIGHESAHKGFLCAQLAEKLPVEARSVL